MTSFLRTAALVLLVLSRTPAFAALPESNQNSVNNNDSQNQICPLRFKHSLTGLYGIKPFSLQTTQPYSDFDTLYSKSYQAQSELETICKNIALHSNAAPHFSGIKSKQRASEKIEGKLKGQVNQITDISRATIVANDIPTLVEAYEILSRETNVVQVKNRFKYPKSSGYRDLNVLVQLPKTNLIVEVQFHLSNIAQIKSGEEHQIYQQIQKITREANSTNRDINELESKRIEHLNSYSKGLYQQAWLPYITTDLVA